MIEPIHILYIDDNPLDRELVRDVLEKEHGGFRVAEATSRTEFEAQLAKADYDLVLSDFNILGFEGLQVLDTVRAKNPRVPVIIVTGTGSEEVAAEAMKRGAADYVIKSTRHIQRLPHTIQAAIEKKQMEDEHKRAEEALRRSEAQLSNAMKIAMLGYWEYDVAEDTFTFNDHFYAIFRTSVEQVGGYILSPARYAELFLHPDDMPLVAAEVKKAIETTDPHYSRQLEHRIIYADGEIGYISVRFFVVKDDQGRTIKTFGANQDITERKRAEQALRESESKYRTLVENIPQKIFTKDRDSVYVSCNENFARDLGIKPDQIVGKTDYDFFPQELADKYRMDDQRIMEKGQTEEIEDKYLQAGQEVLVQTVKTPIRQEDGRVTGTLGVFWDITARKQAEEERNRLTVQVREQARQIEKVLATVPAGVLLLDAEGRVLRTNPVAEKDLVALAGVKEGAVLSHLGDRPLENLLTSPPTKGLWHEVKMAERTFEVIARPVENGPEPEYWVMVVNDVTQEREFRAQLEQQEQLAAVGQLAAGIAHDFNNILAVIVLYTHLELRIPELPERLRERLETIAEQANRATDLIQQILDFSRRAMLERRPMDLLPFMKEIVKLLERTIPEHIEIGLSCGADEYTVHADPTRIQQMVMNLAVNARDAMPDGGRLSIGLERVAVEPGLSPLLPEMEAGEWVKVTVSDSGRGVPTDVLPHIFEPFFTTKEPGEGTGLGLAQVYGIVGQHGGRIGVETQLGKGTTFIIYLPALMVRPDEPSLPDVVAMPQGRGQLVLVVEDEETLRAALAASLEQLNYRVLAAANGEQALAVREREGEEIALVLSDVVMPVMGGIALFHALKQRAWDIPMILMTGHAMGKELEALREQGLAAWLPKPPSLERLAQAIDSALSK